jgi:hypothetical protein
MTATWRTLRLSVATRACLAGWQWGKDPRRFGGLCLVSPRGTCFEIVFRGWMVFRRRYQPLDLPEGDR